jgi:hypothetical protein
MYVYEFALKLTYKGHGIEYFSLCPPIEQKLSVVYTSFNLWIAFGELLAYIYKCFL